MIACRPTTPHKLQGCGEVGKTGPALSACAGPKKTDGRVLSAFIR